MYHHHPYQDSRYDDGVYTGTTVASHHDYPREDDTADLVPPQPYPMTPVSPSYTEYPPSPLPPLYDGPPDSRPGTPDSSAMPIPPDMIEPSVSLFGLFRFADRWDWLMMLVGTILAAVNGVGQPLMTLIFSNLIGVFTDYAQALLRNDKNAQAVLDAGVIRFIYYYMMLAGGTFVVAFIQATVFTFSAERQVRRIREGYYRSVLKQEQAFFDFSSSGDLNARLNNDISLVQGGISSQVSGLIGTICTFVVALVIAFTQGWKVALVVIGALPLMGIITVLLARMITKYSLEQQRVYAKAVQLAEEVFGAIKTVSAFGAQRHEARLYDIQMMDVMRLGNKKTLWAALGSSSMFFIVFSAHGLAFWYGVTLVMTGEMTGVQVISVVFAMIMGAFAISGAFPSIAALTTAQGAAARVYGVIQRKSAIDPTEPKGTPGKIEIEHCRGELEFRNVSFRYPTRPDVEVLKNVSLKINPGETVALVGSSGSGKSSLVALAERFYDPTEGQVLIDGVDIKQARVGSVRKHIGLVGQEPVLFGLSIYENVAWGATREDGSLPTREEVVEACTLANAAGFIANLPDGYDTKVGSHGGLLSGGQKQRIAIARAIIKNPAILLLDEATSALDTESERIVQAALDRVSKNRTTLVVAHRLSTIRNANLIIVMDRGEIMEYGTHDQLIAMNGMYTSLAKAQEVRDEVDDLPIPPYTPLPGAGSRLSAMTALTRGGSNGKGFGLERRTSARMSKATRLKDEAMEFVSNEYEGRSRSSRFMALPEPVEATFERKKSGRRSNRFSEMKTSAFHRQSSLRFGGVPEEEGFEEEKILPYANEEAKGAHSARPNSIFVMSGPEAEEAKLEAYRRASFPWGRVLAFVRPEKWLLVTGTIGAALDGAVLPLFSLIFANMLSVFETPEKARIQAEGNFWSLMFLVVACISFGTSFARSTVLAIASEMTTRRIRSISYRMLLRQDMAFFDLPENGSGAITARLGIEARAVSGVYGSIFGGVTMALTGFGFGISIAFMNGWKLSLVVLACVPLLALTSVIEMRIMTGYGYRSKVAFESSAQLAYESIDNPRTVAALSRESAFDAMFSKAIDLPYRLAIKGGLIGGLGSGFGGALPFLVYALVFWYGSRLVLWGEYDPDQVFRVMFSVVFAAMALGQLMNTYPGLAGAKVSALSLFELLDRQSPIDPTDVNKADEGMSSAFFDGSVEAKKVTFSYPTRPDAPPALRNFDLMIKPGQTVALVGESGSGKSTIVALVQRFYDVDAGSLCLQNWDVRDWPLQELRAGMACVGQEPVLFDRSIRDNITYGKFNVSDELIEAAAKAANIHNTIVRLPDKYDTRVGSRGAQLSGGQKQRIAIARALVRNPKLLLLDEATSALDSESERVVQRALDKAAKGRTTIVVAHRLSTIQNADVIVVMRRGKMIEMGKHDELMKRHGAYWELSQQQSLSSTKTMPLQ